MAIGGEEVFGVGDTREAAGFVGDGAGSVEVVAGEMDVFHGDEAVEPAKEAIAEGVGAGGVVSDFFKLP